MRRLLPNSAHGRIHSTDQLANLYRRLSVEPFLNQFKHSAWHHQRTQCNLCHTAKNNIFTIRRYKGCLWLSHNFNDCCKRHPQINILYICIFCGLGSATHQWDCNCEPNCLCVLVYKSPLLCIRLKACLSRFSNQDRRTAGRLRWLYIWRSFS